MYPLLIDVLCGMLLCATFRSPEIVSHSHAVFLHGEKGEEGRAPLGLKFLWVDRRRQG